MKHVRQQKNECSLAVCSMLSGAKYSAVQAYAEEQFPFQMGKGFWPEQVNDIFSHFGQAYHTQADHDVAPHKQLSALDLQGRGYFLYRPLNQGMYHIVAYLDGVIYDPDEKRQHSMKKWVRDYASPEGIIQDTRVIQRRAREK